MQSGFCHSRTKLQLSVMLVSLLQVCRKLFCSTLPISGEAVDRLCPWTPLPCWVEPTTYRNTFGDSKEIRARFESCLVTKSLINLVVSWGDDTPKNLKRCCVISNQQPTQLQYCSSKPVVSCCFGMGELVLWNWLKFGLSVCAKSIQKREVLNFVIFCLTFNIHQWVMHGWCHTLAKTCCTTLENQIQHDGCITVIVRLISSSPHIWSFKCVLETLMSN